MSSTDALARLDQLIDQAHRLVRRAAEFASGVDPNAPITGSEIETVRLALSRLDQLLREGRETLLPELRTEAPGGDGAAETMARTILEVTRTLSAVLEEDELFDVVMDLVIEHSRAERGFFFLSAGDDLVIRAARNVDQQTIEGAEREISQTVVAKVRETREPYYTRNALDDDALRSKQSVVALQILSVLAAPILLDGEVYGVVYLESRSVKGLFDESDRTFLRMFCDHAGVAFRNSLAFARVRHEESRLAEENARLRAEVSDRFSFHGIIGRSRPMRDVFALAERVGRKPVSVLIRGENGTGKELIAKVIHYQGTRTGPFVSVNCAALPETLIESELFGIEKGTATGVEGRAGKFEQANGGTLFLDEIGDMSLVVQAKVLRVVQEKQFERVGGRKSIDVDVRIIAATNIDLENAIAEKRFREDLYYRLKVIELTLPALRDRPEDIPLLADHFLSTLGQQFESPGRRLTPAALDALCKYDWPGNVRELENVISRALVLSQDETIDVDLLSPEVRAAGDGDGRSLSLDGATLEDLEQTALVQALEKHDWIQTRAAGELGISERNLRYKMKKFGIQRPRGGRVGPGRPASSGS